VPAVRPAHIPHSGGCAPLFKDEEIQHAQQHSGPVKYPDHRIPYLDFTVVLHRLTHEVIPCRDAMIIAIVSHGCVMAVVSIMEAIS
jgi:hypothetical protein